MVKIRTYLGAALALCLPVMAFAVPHATAPVNDGPSRIIPAQVQIQGWWEQQGRPDEARERYSHLRGEDARRYNELQYQINDMQARIDQLQHEQQRILRWDRR